MSRQREIHKAYRRREDARAIFEGLGLARAHAEKLPEYRRDVARWRRYARDPRARVLHLILGMREAISGTFLVDAADFNACVARADRLNGRLHCADRYRARVNREVCDRFLVLRNKWLRLNEDPVIEFVCDPLVDQANSDNELYSLVIGEYGRHYLMQRLSEVADFARRSVADGFMPGDLLRLWMECYEIDAALELFLQKQGDKS